MKTTLLTIISLLVWFNGITQITLDETLTGQQLAEDILMDDPAFTITNATVITGSDFGFDNGIAAFEIDTSVFPFSGLVLATGAVSEIIGPNLNILGSGGWPGDADLEDFTDSVNTNDASSISFDFTSEITELKFGVIFTSEEYDQNFECIFADAFAIILTNNDTNTSINLGTLPDTGVSISTISVRPEVAGQCEAVNPEYFGFYNFQPFNDENESITNFNGQTAIIPVETAIEAGVSYNLKIVIGDSEDPAFNSAIFIKQGNFSQDADLDNISNTVEDRNNNGNFDDDDSDNDTIPNYLDSDDDGDNVPSQIEVFEDINGVVQRKVIDTDNDLIENYLDDDDDGDGILTINEDYNNNGDPTDDDTNNNNIPDYLDADVALTTDTFKLSSLSVYPNPAINEIVISGDHAFAKASIFNLKGELVLNYEGGNQKSHTIDISKMPHGIFFIKIDGFKKAFKILKK